MGYPTFFVILSVDGYPTFFVHLSVIGYPTFFVHLSVDGVSICQNLSFFRMKCTFDSFCNIANGNSP